jgi:hypothetical protein
MVNELQKKYLQQLEKALRKNLKKRKKFKIKNFNKKK